MDFIVFVRYILGLYRRNVHSSFKIVDDDGDGHYYIQSNNLRTVLKIDILSIINNEHIIENLPSEQAAYIGFMAGVKYVTKFSKVKFVENIKKRYGDYQIVEVGRSSIIKLITLKTGEMIYSDCRYLFRNKKIIRNIDSTQAFLIGYITGQHNRKRGSFEYLKSA